MESTLRDKTATPERSAPILNALVTLEDRVAQLQVIVDDMEKGVAFVCTPQPPAGSEKGTSRTQPEVVRPTRSEVATRITNAEERIGEVLGRIRNLLDRVEG